jgi:hypothetical protein
MKIFLLHILLLMGFSVSFAQVTCNIKKAYAFYSESMPGTQMVDEKGNPIPFLPRINRFIYVEYSGSKKPEIKSVLYNNVVLSFSVERVKEKTVLIGDQSISPNNTITAKKGSTFLKIILYPDLEKPMPEIDCKNILIKSKAGGKICTFYLNLEKQFSTLPSY